ncbi:MAG: M18 family aminopeptidase [Clostridia bacterium]|nr:M18 family aminopeptidase [Clostridia bacterium]
MKEINKKLFDFIEASPTAFHTVREAERKLLDTGFIRLEESEEWRLERCGSYYTTRNGSSLIAFRIPEDINGFMIGAAHSDSPCFKIKDNPDFKSGQFVRLSTEKYGGMICATWLDRPLGVAGRIAVRTASGVETRLVDLSDPVCIIPSVAIHMNRNANDNVSYNPAVDMVPLAGIGDGFSLLSSVAASSGIKKEDIIGHDLYLYNPEKGIEFDGLISSPRLDDLECVFALTEAFSAAPGKAASVMCIFDNEEVGSATRQGAASTFLRDVLRRISDSFGMNEDCIRRTIASSMMLSFDNAHAVHPNHPEYSDKNNSVVMNGGIVIKHNASYKYTTDAVSSALFRLICEKAGVPTQNYANRSDIPGGSTLGAIASTKVSAIAADIGLAQLAMHSSYETAGADDLGYLISALKTFFSSSVVSERDGRYVLN